MLFFVLAAAGAVAGAAAPVIVLPDAVITSKMLPLRAAWPTEAWRRHLDGEAILTCVVNVHGLLDGCKVASETPAGIGFGAAALLLAPNLKLPPLTRDGAPVAATMNVPIIFKWTRVARIDALHLPSGESGPGETAITHAVWQAAPSFADMARVYPAGAGGVTAHVVLRCEVMRGGALKDCDTSSEEPPGKGFAKAARALVPLFRMQVSPAQLNAWRRTSVDVPISLMDPAGPEMRDRRIADPTWVVALDPAKAARVYPEAASAAGLKTGLGVATCTVAADGSLTGCKPAPGQPEGMGFSEAAVAVASVMKMNIWTDEGGPVDGAIITLPFRFNLAPAPSAADSPPR